MTSPSRTTLSIGAAALLVALLAAFLVVRLAGDDEPAAQKPLAEDVAASATLTAEDLGGDYTPGTDEATSYAAQAPGCLAAIRSLTDGREARVRVLRVFRGPVTQPASVISSQVSSYADEAAAAAALAALTEATTGCTEVRRAKGRTGFEGEVTTQQDPSAHDGQLRVQATGRMLTSNDQGLPLGLWTSVTRIGSSLAIVRLTVVPAAGRDEASVRSRMDALTAAAAGRLQAAT